MADVVRTLTAFRRGPDDSLVHEWPLGGLELPELQEMFAVRSDDPMYECFPVGPDHVSRLERATGQTLDLVQFDYFVEARA
jgi:hypothetical protein